MPLAATISFSLRGHYAATAAILDVMKIQISFTFIIEFYRVT